MLAAEAEAEDAAGDAAEQRTAVEQANRERDAGDLAAEHRLDEVSVSETLEPLHPRRGFPAALLQLRQPRIGLADAGCPAGTRGRGVSRFLDRSGSHVDG